MNLNKDEQERRYYNRKLIKEEFRNGIKSSHKINWIDLITTTIGCFLGLCLCDAINLDHFITSTPICFILQVLIVASLIMIVKAIINCFAKMQKKQD